MLLYLAFQVTTTCVPMGGQVTCHSQPMATVPAPGPITQVDVPRAIRSMPRYEAPPPVEPITSFQEELARRMGALVRQRRCEDSFRLAALAGEIELADASRRVCPFEEPR